MEFYYVYFLFQLTEMVDGIIREVAALTFRFEHDQTSDGPSGYLLQEIKNLKNKQNKIKGHMRELLDYLTDLRLE